MATSVTRKIIRPDGSNLQRSYVGKSRSLNDGRNKLPDYCRASTGSYNYGGNSRTYHMGKSTTPNNGQNILPRHIRASTGSFHNVVNLRRISSGKPSFSPNSGKSVDPHNLRASTGSCHDFCKHGQKHESEVNVRSPLQKRMIAPPSDKRYLTGFGVPAERKTTAVVKPKPSVSKILSPSSPGFIKQKVSAQLKKVLVSSKQVLSSEKKIALNENKKTLPGKHTPVKPKTITVKKPLSSPGTSGGLNGRRNSEIETAKKIVTSKADVKKITASPAVSLSPKPSISKITSLNVKKYTSFKLVSPLKDQNRIGKAKPKHPSSEKVPVKTLHVIVVEAENKVLESTQNGSAIHSPLSLTLSSPKCSSLPESPALSSHEEEALEKSEYTDSEVDGANDYISESSKTVNMNEVERTPKEGGVGVSDDNDCAPSKLKFRRGKVVDLQSANSGLRRLRFRPGKILGENQDAKADVQKISFKESVVWDDTNGTDPDPEKVVLRNQGVEGKKDAKGLLNNEIEETASKLVESRRSKVKALVGAFETVISRHESRPSI